MKQSWDNARVQRNSALFVRLVTTSKFSVVLYDNCKYFFDILNFYKGFVIKFSDFNFVTTFNIRKIKDERRIMSQATGKEVGFSSQHHFQLLWYLLPHKFNCIKTHCI